MTLLHLRILDVSSDTPRSTCVHPPQTALASGLDCLFPRRDYPTAVIHSGIQRQNCAPSCRQTALSGIIAAFKTHNS